MGILRGRESSRVRATIRGVVPAVVTLLGILAALALVQAILGAVTEGASATAAMVAYVVAYVALSAVYVGLIRGAIWWVARLEERPSATFGLDVDADWGRDFAAGAAITVIGVAASLWWGQFRGFRDVDLASGGIEAPESPLLVGAVIAVWLCFFLIQNVYEEVIYRRIVLRNFVEGLLARGVSPTVAVVPATVASLSLFGAYHVPLRGNAVVAIDAALVGITFALAYLLTGDLGLPIGIHFGRVTVELLTGISIAEVEIVAVVAFTRDTLPANLEIKLLRLGLICLCILAWAEATRGDIGLAESITERHGDQSGG